MNGTERCKQYVADVLSGDVIAPKTVIQACERFNRDKTNSNIYFDDKAANAAVANIEKLPHAKGRLQGKKIHLEHWQCFFVCNLFGWKWKKNGFRRFRRAYERVPRKNGKSLLAICIALQMFGPDMEPGAEVYLGATSQDQAKDLLFKPAKYIVEKASVFRERFGIEVNASNLIIPANFSQLKSVIKKPDDGFNPHCAVVDEYHEHETDEQYSTFDTGMGSREQPLLLVTTTAGSNLGGPCKEMDDVCLQILNRAIDDESLFILIYTPDVDDEWSDPAVLRKVNPNIGISVSEDYLLDQQNIARQSATTQNAFRTKHLNEWIGAKTAWMNMLAYQACRKDISLDSFTGRRCYIGLDLATKKDIASMAIVFPPIGGGKWTAFVKHYLPDAAVYNGAEPRYKAWAADKWLTVTPGNITDYSYIEDDLIKLRSQFEIAEVPYDPFQATQFSTRMMEEGFSMVEVGATVKNLSEPMKELEALILKRDIEFQIDPVLMWMFGNVTAKLDIKDNIFPNKERYESKIDGVVALIMAISRTMNQVDSYAVGKVITI